MRYVFVLFLLFALNLYSYSQKAVKTTIRSAAEEVITKVGFSLLSEDVQNEALKEQASQTGDGDCIDDSCLMDTGKMLAAQRLFLIKISDLGNYNYMFKISDINLETNEKLSVFSKIYRGELSDVNKLFDFSKSFLKVLSQNNNKKSLTQRIPVMLEVIFDFDDNAKEKEFSIKDNKIKKESKLFAKPKFNFINTEFETTYIHSSFDFQKNSEHFLTGIKVSLLNWSWKFVDFALIGGGFYLGLDDYKMFSLHLFKLDFKISNFKINFAIGPFLGDYYNLYDNIQDSYLSYGGMSFEYDKKLKKYLSVFIKTYYYLGCKNSQKSFYDKDDNSMEDGSFWGLNIGLRTFY